MANPEEQFGTSNICEGCPAAYALEFYTEEADSSTELSPARQAMQKNEAVVAREILDRAAGKVACLARTKRPVELPKEIPEVGSAELLSLVSRCPGFATYASERTGQPKALIQLGMFVTRALAYVRAKGLRG